MATPKQIDATFRALGNKRRRQILELLEKEPRAPLAVAREFDVTWPAISRHLTILLDAGLIRLNEEVRPHAYELRAGAADAAVAWLRRFGAS